MVVGTSLSSFSGEDPQPGLVAAGGSRLRALDLETGAAQQREARLPVVVAPPHGRARSEFTGQLLERRRVFGVLARQVPFGYAVVAGFDRSLERCAQRAVTPPSTIMHAPMHEA